MTSTANVYEITPQFKLHRVLICSLHSFYIITSFYIIYSAFESAELVLASVTPLTTTAYWKYKNLYHVFQVIFFPLQTSAVCTFQINSKNFTGDKVYYLSHTWQMRRGTHQPHRTYLFSTPLIPFYLINAWRLFSMLPEKSGLGRENRALL